MLFQLKSNFANGCLEYVKMAYGYKASSV